MNNIFGTGRPGTPPRPPRSIEPVKPVQPQQRMRSDEFRQKYGDTGSKNAKNAYIGRNNKKNGKTFEEMLEAACDKYLYEKVAKVTKSVEKYRVIGVLNDNPGKSGPLVFKCVQERAAEPDFKGLLASGRALAFEAKTTEQDRIEWAEVSEHQRQHLEEHYNMNGLAFVMVSFGFRKFFRIPWWVWRDMKALYGRKYLMPDEIPEFEVPLMAYYGKPAVMFLEDIEDFPARVAKEDGS